jgi:hypothetical protein
MNDGIVWFDVQNILNSEKQAGKYDVYSAQISEFAVYAYRAGGEILDVDSERGNRWNGINKIAYDEYVTDQMDSSSIAPNEYMGRNATYAAQSAFAITVDMGTLNEKNFLHTIYSMGANATHGPFFQTIGMTLFTTDHIEDTTVPDFSKDGPDLGPPESFAVNGEASVIFATQTSRKEIGRILAVSPVFLHHKEHAPIVLYEQNQTGGFGENMGLYMTLINDSDSLEYVDMGVDVENMTVSLEGDDGSNYTTTTQVYASKGNGTDPKVQAVAMYNYYKARILYSDKTEANKFFNSSPERIIDFRLDDDLYTPLIHNIDNLELLYSGVKKPAIDFVNVLETLVDNVGLNEKEEPVVTLAKSSEGPPLILAGTDTTGQIVGNIRVDLKRGQYERIQPMSFEALSEKWIIGNEDVMNFFNTADDGFGVMKNKADGDCFFEAVSDALITINVDIHVSSLREAWFESLAVPGRFAKLKLEYGDLVAERNHHTLVLEALRALEDSKTEASREKAINSISEHLDRNFLVDALKNVAGDKLTEVVRNRARKATPKGLSSMLGRLIKGREDFTIELKSILNDALVENKNTIRENYEYMVGVENIKQLRAKILSDKCKLFANYEAISSVENALKVKIIIADKETRKIACVVDKVTDPTVYVILFYTGHNHYQMIGFVEDSDLDEADVVNPRGAFKFEDIPMAVKEKIYQDCSKGSGGYRAIDDFDTYFNAREAEETQSAKKLAEEARDERIRLKEQERIEIKEKVRKEEARKEAADDIRRHEGEEKKRLERERAETLRLERERAENLRLERERVENLRLERERAENLRLERERERAENLRLERERVEKKRRAAEKAKKEREFTLVGPRTRKGVKPPPKRAATAPTPKPKKKAVPVPKPQILQQHITPLEQGVKVVYGEALTPDLDVFRLPMSIPSNASRPIMTTLDVMFSTHFATKPRERDISTFHGENVKARLVLSNTRNKPFTHFYALWSKPGRYKLQGADNTFVLGHDSSDREVSPISTVVQGYGVSRKGKIAITATFASGHKWEADIEYDLKHSYGTVSSEIKQVLYKVVKPLDPLADRRRYSVVVGFHTPLLTKDVAAMAFIALGVLPK